MRKKCLSHIQHSSLVGDTQTLYSKITVNYRKFYARLADASEYIERGETGPIYVILKDALTYSDPTMPKASEIAVIVEKLEGCLSTDEITAARLLLAMRNKKPVIYFFCNTERCPTDHNQKRRNASVHCLYCHSNKIDHPHEQLS